MFSGSKTRTVAIALFGVSVLWICALVVPLFYYIVAGSPDLKSVVNALEGRETPSEQLAPLVEKVLDQGGKLKRAVPVGYYTGVTATARLSGTQTTKMKRVSYIAWFEKLPHPILILISVRDERAGKGYCE